MLAVCRAGRRRLALAARVPWRLRVASRALHSRRRFPPFPPTPLLATRPASSSSSSPPPPSSSPASLPASMQNRMLASTEEIFRSESTASLVRKMLLFEAVSVRPLVDACVRLLSAELQPASPQIRAALSVAAAPLRWGIRRFVFRVFTGGETLAEAAATIRAARARTGVGAIIDHSTEEFEDAAYWDTNLGHKISLLETAAATEPAAGAATAGGRQPRQQAGQPPDGRLAGFVPIKITSLLSPAMLEQLSEDVRVGRYPLDTPLPSLEQHVAPATWAAVQDGASRLGKLCEAADRLGVRLLFDAEQSYRQPGVHMFVWHLMSQFNSSPASDTEPRGGSSSSGAEGECDGGGGGGGACVGACVVYDTFQMYLADKADDLRAGLRLADEGGFMFAAKIVRGAYVVAEALRAEQMGYPSPLHPSKAATDVAYDSAIQMLLERLGSAGGGPGSQNHSNNGGGGDDSTTDPATAAAARTSVVIATHNQLSVQKAVDAMEAAGLDAGDGRVHFAQIMGMCDSISLLLGSRGFNALKLVPYGSFDEVLPWLLRRLTENQDIFGATQFERRLMKREVRRRVLGR